MVENQQRAERRLAAVFAADVAGYSRLMGTDEERTLRALKGHRLAVLDPQIAAHRGRIVKTTGDGVLVEFASVGRRCRLRLRGPARDGRAQHRNPTRPAA